MTSAAFCVASLICNLTATTSTLGRGNFRVRGDTIEVHPAYEEQVLRIEMFGDTVDRITMIDPLTGEQLSELTQVWSFRQRTTWLATSACAGRRRHRGRTPERLTWFETEGKLLEAQRLRMRTQYDLEMMQEVGYCNGIENYSTHIDGRVHGEPPFTLIDYFPKDFLLVIDESHVAVPQLHGQYMGDLQPQRPTGRARVSVAQRPRQPPLAIRRGA